MAQQNILKASIDLDTIRPRLQDKYERSFRLLRDAERLLLSPHPDADGLSAAALIVTGFKIPQRRWMLLPINTASRSYAREDLREVFRYRPDIITFLDLSPNNERQLQLLKRRSSLVLVDHHRPPESLMPLLLLGINPEPDIHSSAGAYPSGKLVYDLIGASARPDLALVSIMGDQTQESWRVFLKSFTPDELELAERVARRLSLVGPAHRIDMRENRHAILKRQRALFGYLVQSKSLPAFLSAFEAAKSLKETYDKLEEGITANTGKAQVAAESGMEFVHIQLKGNTPYSIISGVLSRLELVAPNQTLVISEPWYRGVELRAMTNDPDIDVSQLFKGFGGGHASIGGGHSEARASEVLDVLRERWTLMKGKPPETAKGETAGDALEELRATSVARPRTRKKRKEDLREDLF
jgi:nanoRNase/pAp phosphatase (c-di-AMP/oligoRNAs hydrolase)